MFPFLFFFSVFLPQSLRKALRIMGAPNLLAENMEYGLSYSVVSYLKKLSQQVWWFSSFTFLCYSFAMTLLKITSFLFLFCHVARQRSNTTAWSPWSGRNPLRSLASRCDGGAAASRWRRDGTSSSSCRVSQESLPLCLWSSTPKSFRSSTWHCSTK